MKKKQLLNVKHNLLSAFRYYPEPAAKIMERGEKLMAKPKIAHSVIGFVLKLIVINDKVKCEYCVGIRLCSKYDKNPEDINCYQIINNIIYLYLYILYLNVLFF